jgi:cathepsin B
VPGKKLQKLNFRKKKIFKTSNEDLPESFDLREQYPQCESLKEIRDQSRCGSCWAFAAAETMSDRICIHSNGQLQTRVSPLHLLSCCSNCGYGCFGGFPAMAFTYWKNEGIPTGGLYGDTTTCKPYFLPPCDNHMTQCEDYVDTPTCEETCQEGYPKTLEEDKTYGVSSYSIKGVDNIMKEIYENGPVEATFLIYEDFGDYDSGVYQHVTGSSLGAHAVKILGWGINEEGVKYWLVANSWNESWGEKGFFRIIRGTNDCGIESAIVSGMPKI